MLYLNIGLANSIGYPPHQAADVARDLDALGMFPTFFGNTLNDDREPVCIFSTLEWPSETVVNFICRKYGQPYLLAYCEDTQRGEVLGPNALLKIFDPSRFFLSPDQRLAQKSRQDVKEQA